MTMLDVEEDVEAFTEIAADEVFESAREYIHALHALHEDGTEDAAVNALNRLAFAVEEYDKLVAS